MDGPNYYAEMRKTYAAMRDHLNKVAQDMESDDEKVRQLASDSYNEFLSIVKGASQAKSGKLA